MSCRGAYYPTADTASVIFGGRQKMCADIILPSELKGAIVGRKTRDERPKTRLAYLRRRQGLTQPEAAAMFGASIGAWRHYEYGERPIPLDVAKRVAERFGVTIDYLSSPIDGTDNVLSFPSLPAPTPQTHNPNATEVIALAQALLRIDPEIRDLVYALVDKLSAKEP